MSDDLNARLDVRAEEFRKAVDGISAASAKILADEPGDKGEAAVTRMEALADRFWNIVEHQHAMTVHLKPDAKGKLRWHRPNATVMSKRDADDYFHALNGWRPGPTRLQRIADALRVMASFGGYRAR